MRQRGELLLPAGLATAGRHARPSHRRRALQLARLAAVLHRRRRRQRARHLLLHRRCTRRSRLLPLGHRRGQRRRDGLGRRRAGGNVDLQPVVAAARAGRDADDQKAGCKSASRAATVTVAASSSLLPQAAASATMADRASAADSTARTCAAATAGSRPVQSWGPSGPPAAAPRPPTCHSRLAEESREEELNKLGRGRNAQWQPAYVAQIGSGLTWRAGAVAAQSIPRSLLQLSPQIRQCTPASGLMQNSPTTAPSPKQAAQVHMSLAPASRGAGRRLQCSEDPMLQQDGKR